MADKAHRLTDEKLEEMEKRLSAIYSEAQKDIQKKADEYFAKFEKADEEKRKLVKVGKLTEDEYKSWRQGKIMYGKRFTAMKEDVAKQLLNVNQTATAYINGELPEIYALNYNALEKAVDGVGGYSFTLVDADTVKHLATTDKSLLPFRELDPAKDIPWNMKAINSEVLQGIVQGESIPDMSKRIFGEIMKTAKTDGLTDKEMGALLKRNRDAAIRSARTIVTGAENKGRQDSYARAEADGIVVQKEWIATGDFRVRHWHAELDGQLRNQEDPFVNSIGEIMYPGDPSADGANVYNCRCTMAARVISINGTKVKNRLDYAERETVQDWIEKDPDLFDIKQKMAYNKSADQKQYSEYKSRLGGEMPKGGFAAFQTMKYLDASSYDELKSYYRYKGRVPEANKSDFEIAQRIKAKGVVGTVRVPAMKMETSNLSVVNEHAYRHGCTIEDAKRYIESAKVSITRTKWDGLHINFYSLEGAAYINADGKVNTIYSKEDFKGSTSEIIKEFL